MLPTISTGAIVTPPADLPHGEQQHFDRVVAAKIDGHPFAPGDHRGMIFIGARHFDNMQMGMGAAVLYLLLPYMAEMTGRRADTLCLRRCLVWAIVFYRQPLVAGMFLGLAAGRHLLPAVFAAAVDQLLLAAGAGAVHRWRGGDAAIRRASLVFTSPDMASFWLQLRAMFGIRSPAMDGLGGIWRVRGIRRIASRSWRRSSPSAARSPCGRRGRTWARS